MEAKETNKEEEATHLHWHAPYTHTHSLGFPAWDRTAEAGRIEIHVFILD